MSLAALTAWFIDAPEDAAIRVLSSAIPPAFVLAGTEDILSGVQTVRAYTEALGAELRWLEDCGHYPWVEHPQQFRTALASWLALFPI